MWQFWHYTTSFFSCICILSKLSWWLLYTSMNYDLTKNAELKGNFKKHEFSCQPFSVPHHFCNPKFHFIYYVNLLITARNIFHWVMLTKILFWRKILPQKSTLAVHLPHYKLMFKIVNILVFDYNIHSAFSTCSLAQKSVQTRRCYHDGVPCGAFNPSEDLAQRLMRDVTCLLLTVSFSAICYQLTHTPVEFCYYPRKAVSNI